MLDPLDPLDAPARGGGRSRLDALGERYLGALADRTGSTPRRLVLVVGAVLALVVAGVVVAQRGGASSASGSPRVVLPRTSSTVAAGAPAATATSTTAGPLVVDVVGAVVRPGLVRLPGGSRVADAIAAAGGARPDADVAQVNLARLLVDGEQVRLPLVGEVLPVAPAPAAGKGTGTTKPAGPIDLNRATVDDLDALPGVGPATAEAIVSYRDEHGPFRSVEDLLEVPGIGDAKLERLRPLVRV